MAEASAKVAISVAIIAAVATMAAAYLNSHPGGNVQPAPQSTVRPESKAQPAPQGAVRPKPKAQPAPSQGFSASAENVCKSRDASVTVSVVVDSPMRNAQLLVDGRFCRDVGMDENFEVTLPKGLHDLLLKQSDKSCEMRIVVPQAKPGPVVISC
jgi:hypothetical protein